MTRLFGYAVAAPADVPGSSASLSEEERLALSPRHCLVLDLLARGRTPQEITRDIGITRNTFNDALKGARARIGARTTAQATALWSHVEGAYRTRYGAALRDKAPLADLAHDLTPVPPLTAEERLWSRIRQLPDGRGQAARGCWVWEGYTRQGLPRVYMGKPQRAVSVRRLLFQRRYGPLPSNDYLRPAATCRPRCVNPDHMRCTVGPLPATRPVIERKRVAS